jgi:hypothetical protein
MVARLVAAALLATSAGCAATAPLLVEPRLLKPGDARIQVGGAALAPIAGDADALRDARAALARPSDPGSPVGAAADASALDAAAPGLVLAAATKPGIAPVVRTGFGITSLVEGSVRYGGRDLGGGVRWSLYEWRTRQATAVNLSLGADVRGILPRVDDRELVAGAVFRTGGGFGGSIPIVLAWQSDAGLVVAYVGAQIGGDSLRATLGVGEASQAVTVTRLFAAATAGLGIGFRRLRVLTELGIERDWIDAGLAERRIQLRVWSLAPAFSVAASF